MNPQDMKSLNDENGENRRLSENNFTKEANDRIISIINTEEVDKDYRDQHFTGLERILLKYNRFDLIGYQAIKESSIDGMAKDAFLYELSGDYMMAAAYYKKLGYADRLKVVESKLK